MPPLFGLAAGLLLLLGGGEVFASRWSASALALTHLLTLGVLAMVMCGAMLQMLPVVAGSPVPRVVLSGGLVHLLLVGVPALAGAFLTGDALWMAAALLALGAAFTLFVLVVGIALWRVTLPSHTVGGMRAALAALLVALCIGGYLAGGMVGAWGVADPLLWTGLHLNWGLLGWVGLLLIGVSYQVLPMFQVTPEYPLWMRRFWAGGGFVCLSLWLLLGLAAERVGLPAWLPGLPLWLLGLGYLLFFVVTLRLLARRRRRILNPSLLFWYLGIALAVAALLLFAGGAGCRTPLPPPVRRC
ncbi:MAG: hypothetical protein AB2814_00505 [Candidatus Sedimenticola endophacoides]